MMVSDVNHHDYWREVVSSNSYHHSLRIIRGGTLVQQNDFIGSEKLCDMPKVIHTG